MEALQLNDLLNTRKSNHSNRNNAPAYDSEHSNGNFLSYKDLLQEYSQEGSTQQNRQQNKPPMSQQASAAPQKSADDMLKSLSLTSNANNIAHQASLAGDSFAASQGTSSPFAKANIEVEYDPRFQLRLDSGTNFNEKNPSNSTVVPAEGLSFSEKDSNAIMSDMVGTKEITDKDTINRLDFNGDGKLTVFDVTRMTKLLDNDTNGDGVFNQTDAEALKSNPDKSDILDIWNKKAEQHHATTEKQKRISPTVVPADGLSFSEADSDAMKSDIVRFKKITDKETIERLDFNGDGELSVLDITRMSDLLDNDTNGDGVFDQADAEALKSDSDKSDILDIWNKKAVQYNAKERRNKLSDSEKAEIYEKAKKELVANGKVTNPELLEIVDMNNDGIVDLEDLHDFRALFHVPDEPEPTPIEPEPEPEPLNIDYMKGDITGTGKVDDNDVKLMREYILKQIHEGETYYFKEIQGDKSESKSLAIDTNVITKMDLDENGIIDEVDYTILVNLANGKEIHGIPGSSIDNPKLVPYLSNRYESYISKSNEGEYVRSDGCIYEDEPVFFIGKDDEILGGWNSVDPIVIMSDKAHSIIVPSGTEVRYDGAQLIYDHNNIDDTSNRIYTIDENKRIHVELLRNGRHIALYDDNLHIQTGDNSEITAYGNNCHIQTGKDSEINIYGDNSTVEIRYSKDNTSFQSAETNVYLHAFHPTIIRETGSDKDVFKFHSNAKGGKIQNNENSSFTIDLSEQGSRVYLKNVNGVPTIVDNQNPPYCIALTGKISKETTIITRLTYDRYGLNNNTRFKLKDLPGAEEIFGTHESISIEQDSNNPTEWFKRYSKIATGLSEEFYGDDDTKIKLSGGNEITFTEINGKKTLDEINFITPSATAELDDSFVVVKSDNMKIATIETKGKSILTKDNGRVTIELDDESQVETNGDNVIIKAHKGNNDISIRGNKSEFNGGNGNDNIVAEGNGIVINSGDGNNYVNVRGNDANILLGDGKDTVKVYGNNAFIVANGGNNGISVNGKNAIIETSWGDDEININGDDSIIYSGEGNDLISIGGDNVVVKGGNGNDTINIDGENSTIWGGAGKDEFNIQDFGTTINDFDIEEDKLNLLLSFGHLNTTQENNSIVVKDDKGDTIVTLANHGSKDDFNKIKKYIDSHNGEVAKKKIFDTVEGWLNAIQNGIDAVIGVFEKRRAKNDLKKLMGELSKIADSELKYAVDIEDIKPADPSADSKNIPLKIQREFAKAISNAYLNSDNEYFEATAKGMMEYTYTNSIWTIPKFDKDTYNIGGKEYAVSTIGSVRTGNAWATVSWKDENNKIHIGKLEWKGEPTIEKFFNGISNIARDQVRQVLIACVTDPISLAKGLYAEDLSESKKILNNVLGNDFMKERTKDEILKIIDKLPSGKEILEQAKSLIEITQAAVY